MAFRLSLWSHFYFDKCFFTWPKMSFDKYFSKLFVSCPWNIKKIDFSFFNFNLWRLNPVCVPYILNNTIPENSRLIGIQRVIHKFMNNDSLWIIVTNHKIQPSTSTRPGRMTNKNGLTDNCHNFFWSLFIWRNLFIFIIYPFMWS